MSDLICINCKHFVRNPEYDCKTGNADIMKKWWDENKHKTHAELTGELKCCELTDNMKALINMNNIASEILDELKSKNK